MSPRITAVTRNTAVVVLVAVIVGGIGFAAGAEVRGLGTPAWISQLGSALVAAVPAIAMFVRGGRIQKEVATIREQTNGTTSGLVDVTARAVAALAAIAADPDSSRRAAELLRTIEQAAGSTAGTPDGTPPPPGVGSPPTP